MRVAIVINTSWNIYNYRKGIISALLDRRCEVIAIAPKDDFSEKLNDLGCVFNSIEMDNKGINPFNDTILFFRFLAIYKKLRPQVILHYTIKPNVYGTLAAQVLGIPCISNVSGLGTVFIREGLVQKIAKVLYRFAFKFPSRVFFQNSDDLKLFQDLKLIEKAKCGLLPGSGIDLKKLQPREYSRNKVFHFLLIARLLVDKGIREYAEAVKYLKAKNYLFKASIVGFIDRKSNFNISEAELNQWQEEGIIEFLGESKDVSVHITQADCVVLPSYREGTPRSLLEAMALCRPIITTNVAGCKEVVEEGQNGFLCEAKNYLSLASSMEKIMKMPEEELRVMGRKGREIAEKKFDEKIVVEAYLKEIFSKDSHD